MNSNSERHLLSNRPVAIDERFNGPQRAVRAMEVFSLVEIADHLSEIVGSVAVLSEFPVDDEYACIFRALCFDYAVWYKDACDVCECPTKPDGLKKLLLTCRPKSPHVLCPSLQLRLPVRFSQTQLPPYPSPLRKL